MSKELVVREINDLDYKDLSEFCANFPEDNRSFGEWSERLLYWWDDNPAYKLGHPRGALARVNDKIIGFTANIPIRMLWDGQETISANGTTWRVDKSYRQYSMDIWMKHREMVKDFLYFNTTANDMVDKILDRLKFTAFNSAKYGKYYIFNQHKSIVFNNAKSVVLWLHSRILVRSLMNLNQLLSTTRDLKIIKIEHFGSEIDSLWSDTKERYPCTVVRDLAYVKWISIGKDVHYVYNHGSLVGYFTVFPNGNRIYLVDIWGFMSREIMDSVICYIIKQYAEYDIVIPAFNELMMLSCKKIGLIRKQVSHTGYLSSKNIPDDPSKIFFTMQLGDYSI